MDTNDFSVQITSAFLDEYKIFELIEKKDPKRFEDFKSKYWTAFELFRQARNCLTHTPMRSSDYPFLISQETLDLLRTMIRKMSIKAEEVCIKMSTIGTLPLEKPLHEAIVLMNAHNYSYIPIFDDHQRLAYVVSEKSILNLLADNPEGILYDDHTILKDFKAYFTVTANENEYYAFVGRKAFAYEARNMFVENRNNKKCGAIFVTETGSPNEAVLGMITAWDVFNI